MTVPKTRTRKTKTDPQTNLTWLDDTDMVGLELELSPTSDTYLDAQYAVRLHAWFLDRVRQTNPELSAYLHDGESEKPFTISGLEGNLLTSGKDFQLQANQTYRWYVTAVSQPVVQWLSQWVKQLPAAIELRNAPALQIRGCKIALSPNTYRELFQFQTNQSPTVKLSFLTPTSFRRKKHHFPLPVPVNLFHSYLRRWNDFSGIPFEQESFLAWIDENVLIYRHRLESAKVAAGKKGMVTGFTGAIELGLATEAAKQPHFVQLFYALLRLAPYCGTGHKTTFGLGQTRFGWLGESAEIAQPAVQNLLAERIEQLTQLFMETQKRTGGDRARQVCETRATILARRELGESLQTIATDLEMPYETVKSYAKLARRALKSPESE